MHARYVPSRTVSYDLFEAISRREGRETAFVCILDPLSRAIRSKKKTSRLCGAAVFADYPSAAKITVTCFARFLFVSTYLPPIAYWLTTCYLQYTTKEKRNRYVAMLLSPWFWVVVVAIVVGQILFYRIYRNLLAHYKYWSLKHYSELYSFTARYIYIINWFIRRNCREKDIYIYIYIDMRVCVYI